MTGLEVRAVLAVAAVAVFMLLGGTIRGCVDSRDYDKLAAEYQQYKTEVADQHARDEIAATKALEKIIDEHNAVARHNEEVIDALQKSLDTTTADRDLARRLLAAARKAPANDPDSQMPKTPSQRGAAPAGEGRGDEPLVELIGDAAGECRANARQLNALIEELRPQL